MVVAKLKTPISIDTVRKLSVGDIVYISGTIVTARDEGHRRLLELYEKGEKPPIPLEGMVLYHCGPIVKKNEKWEVVAAGPTTSTRMELFEDQIIEKFRVRVIVGKGGMRMRTTGTIMTANGLKEWVMYFKFARSMFPWAFIERPRLSLYSRSSNR